MKDIDIIDAHSHIGIDNTWDIPGVLDEYVEKASLIGIRESLLMPVPMPILSFGQYKIIPLMLASYKDESFIVQGIQDINDIHILPINENPYQYANEILFRSIQSHQNDLIQLHFVPLVHPVYDTIDYLEKMIDEYHPVAFKLHGYSSIFSPDDISDEFFQFVQRNDIPLIIHTDCDTSDYQNSIDWIYRNENTPLRWIKVLEKYDIKAYFAHGARLSKESCHIIRKHPNYVVGLGPDSILSTSFDRMYCKDDYLDTLFSLFDIDKICFDLDYPWNTISYDDSTLDWNSIYRIQSLGLSDDDEEKVFCKNSKRFFKL